MVPLTESLAVVLTFPKSRSTINFTGFNCDISHRCLPMHGPWVRKKHFIPAPFPTPGNNLFTKMLRFFGYFIFYHYFQNQVRSQLYSFRPPKLYKSLKTSMRSPTWKHLHPFPLPVAVVLHGVVVAWPAAGLANDPCAALGQRGANSGGRKLWISHHLRC